MKKLLQMKGRSIAGIFLILVVFPLGALYYMNMGLKWRKERLSELQTYSQLSPSQLQAAYDSLSVVFLEEDNIVITGFVNVQDEELSSLFGENLRKLHQQFDARSDVFFMTHLHGPEVESKTFLPEFIQRYELEDTAQCFFLWGEEAQLASLAREGYRIERAEGDSWQNSPYFALIDSATVRNYYDVRKPEAMKRLVEHIAILIPPKKEREDLIFKRETEK